MLLKFLRLSIFSFLFTSTFSGINFFIGNENSYFSGNFSQFSSIIFSISDIFLFLSVFLFLVFIYQKPHTNKNLSSNLLGKIDFNFFKENKDQSYFNILFFGLITSSFLTSFFIQNFENFLLHISILIKFFSAGFLIFYLPENTTGNSLLLRNSPGIFSKKEVLNTLIFAFAIQSFIAFYQVVFQSSVGLFFLGENNFSENILGIAKIGLSNGENFIRGYGTLAHPNILGLSSLILYFLIGNFGKTGYKFLKNILIIGIFFSFSKTAIIGFFVLKIYEKIFLEKKLQNIFFNLDKIFQNKIKIFYTIFYSSIIIGIFFFLGEKIFTRFQNFFGTGFEERLLQLEISKNIFLNNFSENFTENIGNFLGAFFGIGFGNFILQMQYFTNQILKPWEFQPVHNFFILLGTEIGIFGLGILLFLIGYIFINSKKIFLEKLFLILILFFGSFFDHFLLTSSIGIILFWLILRKIYN